MGTGIKSVREMKIPAKDVQTTLTGKREHPHYRAPVDSVEYINILQRTVGNRAVVRAVAARQTDNLHGAELSTAARSTLPTHVGGWTNRALRPPLLSVSFAAPSVQRQAVAGGGATPGSGQGVDLIFIIRADDDKYTADITQYVKGVLAGQTVSVVDNLEDLFAKLAALVPSDASPRQKVRRIRIVAHGSDTGGVKMSPRGETGRRWFSPQEVQTFAADPQQQELIKRVMAPGAKVEFWGCNIGGVEAAGRAWSDLFQSEFSATPHTFRTGYDAYYRPADRGEPGQTIPGQKGQWVRVTSTAEVDRRKRRLKTNFRTWLLMVYRELVANGDISPLQKENDQLKYMQDLFDRTGGNIKHIEIVPDSKEVGVRPGDRNQRWLELWRTIPFEPGTTSGEAVSP